MLHIYIYIYDISRLRVNNEWNSISVPQGCSHAIERDNFFPFLSETKTESFGLVVTFWLVARKCLLRIPSESSIFLSVVVRGFIQYLEENSKMEHRSGPRLLPYNCFPFHNLRLSFQFYIALSFWQRRSYHKKNDIGIFM